MTTHRLKIWTEYYDAVFDGKKRFEVRKNDRDFKVGDRLWLMEFDKEKQELTGRYMEAQISYMLNGGSFGIEEGYCVLGIYVIQGFWLNKPLKK